MYKLIALDMDGTAFNHEHKISDEVKKSIFYAIEKGVKVVFISGREEFTIKKILKQLNLDTYYAALNGSIISTTYSEKAKFVNILEKKYILDIIDLIEKNNLTAIVFTDDLIFSSDNNDKFVNIVSDFIQPDIKRVKDIKKYILENNIISKILKIGISNEYDILKDLENKLKEKFKDEYTVSLSLPFFLEVMAKNSDKGFALKKICKLNNIDLKETIAIGDGENDIPMLNVASLSVAMGNAMENVKKNAKYITDTNENDGVKKVIMKFI